MPFRTGFIASCFDPFPHPGIIKAMEEAVFSAQLDGFIVALHSDPSIERPEKSKPYMTLQEREIMVKAIKYVWYVESYDTEAELLKIMEETNPDVRVLGDDYKGRESFTGDHLDIPIYYARRYDGWSGTDFRKRIQEGVFVDEQANGVEKKSDSVDKSGSSSKCHQQDY